MLAESADRMTFVSLSNCLFVVLPQHHTLLFVCHLEERLIHDKIAQAS